MLNQVWCGRAIGRNWSFSESVQLPVLSSHLRCIARTMFSDELEVISIVDEA
jgi:hypothetical protein